MRDAAIDDTAFERYVLPDIEILLRAGHSRTRNHTDVEDLVQDTLIRAYRAIEGFDGRHPRAWLLAILRSTHINRNRRRRPQLVRDPDAATDRMIFAASDERTDASVGDETDVQIVRALDERFREVVGTRRNSSTSTAAPTRRRRRCSMYRWAP